VLVTRDVNRAADYLRPHISRLILRRNSRQRALLGSQRETGQPGGE
jgi:hypothetical protein